MLKRCLILVVIAAMALSGSAFAAGEPEGGQQGTGDLANVTAPGALPVVKEPVELSIVAGFYSFIGDINTNAATLEMEKRTGVKVKWTAIDPSGGKIREKISLMVAARTDLPDMFMDAKLSKEEIAQYGIDGLFRPLEDLVEKYGFWTKKAVAYDSAVLTHMTAPDGHVYGIAGYTEAIKDMFSQHFWINKVWLDKLGLALPKTPDELYAVLKAFKTNDLNGDGKLDEIPITSCTDNYRSNVDGFLMNAWIYNNSGDRLNLKSGKVYPAYTQPEWRDGLAFINKLHEEKLLDTEAFVQDRTMMKQQIMGQHVLVGSFPAAKPTNMAPDATEQTRQYVPLSPLKGPKGNQTAGYAFPGVSPEYAANILANCKIPEVAFRWIDYNYSEDARLFQVYGVEDFNWRRAKPGELGLDGKQAIFLEIHKFGAPEIANKIWGYAAPHFVPSPLYLGTVTAQDKPFDAELRWYKAALLHKDYRPAEALPPLMVDFKVLERYSELRSVINSYVSEHIALFITGKKNIRSDADWNSYLEGFNRMGLAEYLQIVQTTYERQY